MGLWDDTKQSIDARVGRIIGRSIDQSIERERAESQRIEAHRAIKYLALSALVTRKVPPELPLAAHELSVFSQNGEDGVIYEICRHLMPNTSFVEFGIEGGRQGNCTLLADVFGWSGLFIESDDLYFSRLHAKYGASRQVKTLHDSIIPENINDVFEAAGVPKELGVLSIDIDGNDYWVWQALHESYRPTILVVEYNSMLPLDEALVQPYEDAPLSTFFGASLRALQELGRLKGYQLVHTDVAGVNAFFVRDELAGQLNLSGDVQRHGINYYLGGSDHTHVPSPRTDWVRP